MTDDQNKVPDQPGEAAPVQNTNNTHEAQDDMNDFHDAYDERLERLGGEPAPVITPEEFARLQRAGQVHIDARGRVRTTRRSDAEAGVSLRKRRAWYG
ncbi:MAG: hypothetical protein ABI835_08105 [Chloroflexota bacterium]